MAAWANAAEAAVNVAQALKIPIVPNFAILIESSKLNLFDCSGRAHWLLQSAASCLEMFHESKFQVTRRVNPAGLLPVFPCEFAYSGFAWPVSGASIHCSSNEVSPRREALRRHWS